MLVEVSKVAEVSRVAEGVDVVANNVGPSSGGSSRNEGDLPQRRGSILVRVVHHNSKWTF